MYPRYNFLFFADDKIATVQSSAAETSHRTEPVHLSHPRAHNPTQPLFRCTLANLFQYILSKLPISPNDLGDLINI
jgi:hypothetical protein